MPQAKRYRFRYHQQELARMGRIIGHPARILIIDQLRARGNVTFGELERKIPLERTTISGHLQDLIKNGLVRLRDFPLGGSCYFLDQEAFGEMKILLRIFVEGEGLSTDFSVDPSI